MREMMPWIMGREGDRTARMMKAVEKMSRLSDSHDNLRISENVD